MIPAYKILIDGADQTAALNLADINVTDKRGFEADTLTFQYADPHFEIGVPSKSAAVQIYLGYENQPLEDKGTFTVMGYSVSGPPTLVSVTATAANVRDSLNSQKNTSYKNKSLGDILQKLASRNKLDIQLSPELADITISHIDQTNESDGNLIARLGRLYGAVANIKDGHLLFTPLSRGTTPIGTPKAAKVINISDIAGQYQFSNNKRHSEYTAVKARWRDVDAGKTNFVEVDIDVGGSASIKIKTILQTFADQATAEAAAEAEIRRLSDMGTKISLSLNHGDATVITETPVVLTGFIPDISNASWVVDSVTHTLNDNGFQTKLSLVKLV